MQKAQLERISNGLAAGAGEAPNDHNIVGAANAIQNILEPLEEYDALTVDDLSAEEITELEEAQEDLQYHMSELGGMLGDLTGNDGDMELPNGKIVSLPKAASSAAKSKDLPDEAGGN